MAGRLLAALLVVVLELLTPLVAVALAPLFYWRLLVSDPRDAATLPIGDISDLHYPYRRWVAEQLARGVRPWWNEFVSGGHSAIGDIQFHTLYPPDQWLATLAGGAFPVQTLEIGMIGHVALAALFTYLLARRLTGSRVGGLVAAIVFAFGGYLTGFPVQQLIILEASVWLPLILLGVDLGADYSLLTAFALGGGGVALAALAGHPQTLFYDLLAAALYGLFKCWRKGRPLPAVPVGMVIVVGTGLAFAAGALYPAFAHLALTDRTDVTYDFSRGGFQLHEALGLILPSGFGGAALYHGVVSLLLVAVALASPFRRSNKLFWLALGVIGLLLSFGGNTFLQGPLYLALGSFKFRDHERTAFYVGLAIAMLAGFGAAELTRFRPPHLAWLPRGLVLIFGVLAGLVAFLLVTSTTTQNNNQAINNLQNHIVFTILLLSLGSATIYGRWRMLIRPGVAGLLIVAVVALDLFSANWQNNLTPGDPSKFDAASPIAAYLENYTSGEFRISSEGLLPGDGNAGMLFRLEDIVGNSPLETSAYHDFDQTIPEITRWQVLNVRYVITKRKLDHPQIHLLSQAGDINLYELDPTMRFPRAYLVEAVVPAASQQQAFDLLKDTDLRDAAVVENLTPDVAAALPAGPDTFGPTGPPTKPSPVDSAVQVTANDGNSQTLSVDARRASFLVLSEVAYPGWQATIDGKATPVYRTDGIVRGIFVPAGQHTVRFSFVPPGLAEGQQVSAAAVGWLKYVVIADLLLHGLWLAFRQVRQRGWLKRRPTRPPLAAPPAALLSENGQNGTISEPR